MNTVNNFVMINLSKGERIDHRGVQLDKTGTSPGAICNNKVTSPR